MARKFKPRKFIDKQSLIINVLEDNECRQCGKCAPILGRTKYSASLSGWSKDLICRACFLKHKQIEFARPIKKAREYCILRWFTLDIVSSKQRQHEWKSLRLLEDEHSS
jgi:hypothetical protein